MAYRYLHTNIWLIGAYTHTCRASRAAVVPLQRKSQKQQQQQRGAAGKPRLPRTPDLDAPSSSDGGGWSEEDEELAAAPGPSSRAVPRAASPAGGLGNWDGGRLSAGLAPAPSPPTPQARTEDEFPRWVCVCVRARRTLMGIVHAHMTGEEIEVWEGGRGKQSALPGGVFGQGFEAMRGRGQRGRVNVNANVKWTWAGFMCLFGALPKGRQGPVKRLFGVLLKGRLGPVEH